MNLEIQREHYIEPGYEQLARSFSRRKLVQYRTRFGSDARSLVYAELAFSHSQCPEVILGKYMVLLYYRTVMLNCQAVRRGFALNKKYGQAGMCIQPDGQTECTKSFNRSVCFDTVTTHKFVPLAKRTSSEHIFRKEKSFLIMHS